MSQNIKQRFEGIQEKVNILEGLHKTCQLAELGLDVPVLNESRYLARALADAAAYPEDSQQKIDAIERAELAVLSGINDSVDTLITFVKKTLKKIEVDYPKFKIAQTAYGNDFVNALESIKRVDSQVVYSRRNRHDRYETYKNLADDKKSLEIISDFALNLTLIEALAQRASSASHMSVTWHAEQLLLALNAWIENSSSSDAQFELFLQAKYHHDGVKKVCIGAEALLRFRIKSVNIPPTDFIPFAEDIKMIGALGRQVLTAAVGILKKNPEIPHIAVNVSALELLDPSYSVSVLDILSNQSVDPKRLEIEITETTALQDADCENHLVKLAESGVRIAIDDFGTGETRFDYLALINPSTLKLDMSLVREFMKMPDTYGKLIKAIKAVGDACDLKVIAEGVEDEKQQQMLQKLGVVQFQGYHFGRPKPLQEFLDQHGPDFGIA